MTLKTSPSHDLQDRVPAVTTTTGAHVQDILMIVLVIMAGALFAINIMPLWLPSLASTIAGEEPKVFWFLSRGSALAAYWILWLSMSLGVIITNKLAQTWPGIPPAYEIHQYTSLFGLGLGLFHALILMGDRYIAYNLFQVLVPFASQNYRPIWVGIGQVAFYLWAAVTASFYVRKQIGKKAWRIIHFASYASFLGILLHGLFSGTDSTSVWAQGLYWFSGGSLLLLTVYRVLISLAPAASTKKSHAD